MSGNTFRPFGDDAIAVLGGEPGGAAPHADCFADEVVIDFPSVAQAVEKMRHAFVETDGGTAVRARVRLSARQAAEGVTLLLDVPVRNTCHQCGGRGETWAEPCVPCGGTGTGLRRHHVDVTVPAGVADGTRFRFTVAARHDPPTRVELLVAVDALARH